ncbi:MAG: DUF3038 domain-containing protein [Oscillatoriales cyanobacterium SM2_1_8]|nr:DUF3038 domain-containing protein [Oscillatoriales cyanobacterium SM2_1_8]
MTDPGAHRANGTSNPVAVPAIVATLAVPSHFGGECPRSLCLDVDTLLIGLECIDLTAIEAIVMMAAELKLTDYVPHRVQLWRMRNANALRRHYQRAALDWERLRALVVLVAGLSRLLAVHLRLLAATEIQIRADKIEALGLQQNQRFLEGFLERFRQLYRSRMQKPLPLNDDELRELAVSTLTQLLFASGESGALRLWNALLAKAV